MGEIRKSDSGYAFTQIVLMPTLTISCEEEEEKSLRLLRKAVDLCLVSRAIALQLKFEPHVQVHKAVPVG